MEKLPLDWLYKRKSVTICWHSFKWCRMRKRMIGKKMKFWNLNISWKLFCIKLFHWSYNVSYFPCICYQHENILPSMLLFPTFSFILSLSSSSSFSSSFSSYFSHLLSPFSYHRNRKFIFRCYSQKWFSV